MVNDPPAAASPRPDELAARRASRPARCGSSSSRRGKPLSLETPIGEDSDLGDFLEDKTAGSPNDTLMSQDLTTQVERALSMLSPKEREILRLRSGSARRASTRSRRSGGASR